MWRLHHSNYHITSLRNIVGTFQRLDKLLCTGHQSSTPPPAGTGTQNPLALHSDKILEHSVQPDLLWKLGLAKLDGSGLVEAEEFLGHVVLLLVGDQPGEEGKQHHQVAQVSVWVLQCLQGRLSGGVS